MAERRFRLDVAAAGLLLAGLAVSLSVLSYDPADPPNASIHPAHPVPSNFLGLVGAWLAGTVLGTFGVAIYAAMAAWLSLVFLLLLRRGLIRSSMRMCGWILVIPC